MTIESSIFRKSIVTSLAAESVEPHKIAAAALTALHSEPAAAAAPSVQGRITLSPQKEGALREDYERLLKAPEIKRLSTLLQREIFSVGATKIHLMDFIDALKAKFQNEIRLIGSSVGHVVTGQEEFKDIDLLNPIFEKLDLKRGWSKDYLQERIDRLVMISAERTRAAIQSVVFSYYQKEDIVELLKDVEKEIEPEKFYLKEECQTAQETFCYSSDLYRLILKQVYKKHFSSQCLIHELYDSEKGGGNRFSLLKIGKELPLEIKSAFNIEVYEEGKYLMTVNGIAKTCAFSKDGLHIPLSTSETRIISLACPIEEAVECLRQRILVVQKADGTEFIKWLDLITLRGFSCNQDLRDETFENFLKKFNLDEILYHVERNFPETNNERRLPCLLNLKSLCNNVEEAQLLEKEIDKKISAIKTQIEKKEREKKTGPRKVYKESLLDLFINNPKLHLIETTPFDLIIELINEKVFISHKQLEPFFKLLDEVERKKLYISLIVFHPEIAKPYNAAQKLKTLEKTSVELTYIDLKKITPPRALELFSRIQNSEDRFLVSLSFELLKIAAPQDESIFLLWLPNAFPLIQQTKELSEYLEERGIILDASSTCQEVILKIISVKSPEFGLQLFKYASKQKLWGEGSEREQSLIHLITTSHSKIREELWNLIEDRTLFIEYFLNAEEDTEKICSYILKSSAKYFKNLETGFLKVIRKPPAHSNTLKIIKMALENKEFAETHRMAISKLFLLLPKSGSELLILCKTTNFSISIDIDSLTDAECQELYNQINNFHDDYFDALGLRLAKRLQITDESLFIHFLARGFFKLTPEEQKYFHVQNPETKGELTIQMIRSTGHGFILYEWMCKEKLWSSAAEQQTAASLLIEKVSSKERQLIWRTLEDKTLLLETFVFNEKDPVFLSDYLAHPSLAKNESSARAYESLFDSIDTMSKENFSIFLSALKNPHFEKRSALRKLSAVQAREALPYFKDFPGEIEVIDSLLEKGFPEEYSEYKKLFGQLLKWLPNTEKRLELIIRGIREKDFSLINDKIINEYLIIQVNARFQEAILQVFHSLCEEYTHTQNEDILNKILLLHKKLDHHKSVEFLSTIREKLFILFSQLNERHYTQEIVQNLDSSLKDLLTYQRYENPIPLEAFVTGCVRSRSDLFFNIASKQALEIKSLGKFSDGVNERIFMILSKYEPKSMNDVSFTTRAQIFLYAYSITDTSIPSKESLLYFKKMLQCLPKTSLALSKILKDDKEQFSTLINAFLRVSGLQQIFIQEFDLFYIIDEYVFLSEPLRRTTCIFECLNELNINKDSMPLRLFLKKAYDISNALNKDHNTSLTSDQVLKLYDLFIFLGTIEREHLDGCFPLLFHLLICQITKELKYFIDIGFDNIIDVFTKKEDIDNNINIFNSIINEPRAKTPKIPKSFLSLLIGSYCIKKISIDEILTRIKHHHDLIEFTLNTIHELSCQVPIIWTPSYVGFTEFLTLIPSHIKHYPLLSKDILLKCFQIHKATGAPDSLLQQTLGPCLREFACRFGIEDAQFRICEQYINEARELSEAPKVPIKIDTDEKLYHCIIELLKNFNDIFDVNASVLDKFENFRSLNVRLQQIQTHRLTQQFFTLTTLLKVKYWAELIDALLGTNRAGRLAVDEAHFDTIMNPQLLDLGRLFLADNEGGTVIDVFIPLLRELNVRLHRS